MIRASIQQPPSHDQRGQMADRDDETNRSKPMSPTHAASPRDARATAPEQPLQMKPQESNAPVVQGSGQIPFDNYDHKDAAPTGSGQHVSASLEQGVSADSEQRALLTHDPGRELPKTEAILIARGLSVSDTKDWLSHLRGLHLSDEELAASLSEDPAETSLVRRSGIRRRALLLKHELVRLWAHQNPIVRLLYSAAWIHILLGAVIKVGFSLSTIISAISIVGMKGWSFFNELKPRHMKLLRRNYDQRKLALQKLLNIQQQWGSIPPTPREQFTFQHEALELIANYVRDHRSDARGQTIFANLIVRRGNKIVVINRDTFDRPVPQEYTREECSLIWDAIETGKPQVTGNLYEQFPHTKPGKSYCSVFVLPVRWATHVVGAVSIDSEGKYHFDGYVEELQTGLAPYVQLLAGAIVEDHDAHVTRPPRLLMEGGGSEG